MALSVFARLVKKNAFEHFEPDLATPQTEPEESVPGGFTRGTLGSQGSTTFQSRNSDAGEDEDRATLQSPIMKAFMERTSGNPTA